MLSIDLVSLVVLAAALVGVPAVTVYRFRHLPLRRRVLGGLLLGVALLVALPFVVTLGRSGSWITLVMGAVIGALGAAVLRGGLGRPPRRP